MIENKSHWKLRIKKYIIKSIYLIKKKSIAMTTLNGEVAQAFSLKSEKKSNVFIILSCSTFTRSFSLYNGKKKEYKEYNSNRRKKDILCRYIISYIENLRDSSSAA